MTPEPQLPTTEISFEALDGTCLSGTLFEPEGEPRGVVLVNSGTGIPRRFYGRFAHQAATRGFVALTFDYRGIGGSAPRSLRGYPARYRDWGQRDIPGAIDWISHRFPDLPLYAVGHSTGGQQLGLTPNVDRIRAAVFVAVSTGYWRGMPAPFRFLVLGLFRGYLPAASRFYGYAPSRKIRFGENLPSGVAREWGAWCQEPEYMAAFFDEGGRLPTPDGEPFGPTFFDRAELPIRAYYSSDDPISTPANVPAMLGLYSQAEIETRWVAPDDLGVSEIGHLGFFRSKVGPPLWDDAFDWLETQA